MPVPVRDPVTGIYSQMTTAAEVIGEPSSAPAATDGGTFGLIPLMKRGLGNWTGLLGLVGILDANPAPYSLMGRLKAIATVLGGTLVATRPPLTYSAVVGSPVTLTAAWQKVCTTTAATRGLRIAPLVSATTFDIEWVSVPAGAAAPTDTVGEPAFAGEDFGAGLPIGDLYLKSATGQVAIVKLGV